MSEPAEHEYYPTPAWVVRRLFDVPRLPGGWWLEPCVGEGHILRAVAELRNDVRWTTQDVRPTAAAGIVADFLKRQPAAPTGAGWDACLTNPPFSKAIQFARIAMEHCRHVVMLQRLGWMGTEARHDFFRATTPNVYVVPEKISFAGDGTDVHHYAWYHWHEGSGWGAIEWLDLTPAAERKGTPAADPRQENLF